MCVLLLGIYSDSFMNRLKMHGQIALLCELSLSLIASILGTLMYRLTQYFVFEQRMTMCLRLSCPLPVIGQLELMWASSANHRSRQLRRRQLVCISRHIAQTTNVVSKVVSHSDTVTAQPARPLPYLGLEMMRGIFHLNFTFEILSRHCQVGGHAATPTVLLQATLQKKENH